MFLHLLSRLRFFRTGFLIVALPGALLAASPAQENEFSSRLNLASDVWPPFTDVLGNTRIAIDLVTEALGRTGQDVRIIVRDDFSALMAQIISGEYDGSAALWLSPEREGFLRFSHPYLENRLILVGRNGSDVSPTDFADLKGKQVAIVGSYAYGLTAEQEEGPVWVSGKSDQENLIRLLEGDVDYLLADQFLVEHLLEEDGERARQALEVGSKTLLKRSLHLAIREEIPDSAEIISRFNEAIREMVADGTYNRILQLNWIRADVDGDGQLELIAGNSAAGPDAPGSAYSLFSGSEESDGSTDGPGYYIGGQLYTRWDEVPDDYKAVPVTPPSSLTGGGMLNLDF